MDAQSEFMPCPLCNEATPADMNFCIACDGQIKCMECGSRTFKGKSFCLKCGKTLAGKQESSTAAPNHYIRTVEGEGATYKERTEVRATDTAVGVFAPAILPMSAQGYRMPQTPIHNSDDGVDASFEEIKDETEVKQLGTGNVTPANINSEPTKKNEEGSALSKLFEETDDGWILYNSELKAISKGDFVKRLTCLFLQLNSERGTPVVSRNDVTKLLHYYGVYDSNVRTWLRGERTLLQVTAKDLKLIGPGKQFVSEILSEISDPDKPNVWKIGTRKKKGPNKKAKVNPAGEDSNHDEDGDE